MGRKRRVSTGLRLEINGHTTTVSGPQRLMARILPLNLMNYVQVDGRIETTIHDPLQYPGRVQANGAVRALRGGM